MGASVDESHDSPSAQPKTPSIQDRVETVARVAGAVGLVAYALGLVTVNAYLLQFGVSDFSLLRARLVYTGALILVVVTIIALWCVGLWVLFMDKPGGLLYRYRTDNPEHSRQRAGRIVVMVIVAFGTSLGPLVAFQLLMDSGDELGDARVAFALLGMGLVGALVSVGMVAAAKEGHEDMGATGVAFQSEGRSDLTRWLRTVGSLAPFTAAALIVVFLGIFVRFVYPAVPEQYGGGRPREARLVLNDGDNETLSAIGLAFSPASGLSSCVELLFAGEDTYVLRAGNDSIVELTRDAVKAVVIEPVGVERRCPEGG